MKFLNVRMFVILSIILQGVACSWNENSFHEINNANLFSTETKSDKSIVYRYRNGASCVKRADYTEAVKAQGAISVKQIFEGSGSFDTRMENAKKYGARFEELEAVFFDICNQYGEGRISLSEYNELWKSYDIARRQIFGQVSSISHGLGSFTEFPATPAGQAVMEYYKAIALSTREGFCRAWSLLSSEKRKQFDERYQWTSCEQFGKEGFRTMEKYETVILNEQVVPGGRTTVDEIIIAIDTYPENPGRNVSFRKPAKDILNSKILNDISDEIIRVIPQYYDVELPDELKTRVREYIANSNVLDIMSAGFLETIALSKERGFKSYVFPIRPENGRLSPPRTNLRNEIRQLFINRRDVVLEDGKWLLGRTKELAVTEY
jgi:hypothetical protein